MVNAHDLWVQAGGPAAENGTDEEKAAMRVRYKTLLIEHGHLVPRPVPQPELALVTPTGPCCERDTDGDGNCDRHLAPGVLR